MTSECTHHQLFFEDSMNATALKHKDTMVEVYSKMKPNTFHVTVANSLDRLLQEDQGGCEPAVAPSPGWSSASSRTAPAPDANPAYPAYSAYANAATPASPPDGSGGGKKASGKAQG